MPWVKARLPFRGKSVPLGAGHRPQKRQLLVLFPPPQAASASGGGVTQGAVGPAAADGFPPGGGSIAGHGGGQHVALAQRPAPEPAQAAGQVGRAAAPHLRHRNAAPSSQVAAQAGAGGGDLQHAARRGKQRRIKRHRDAVQRGGGFGPGQGKDRGDLKPQLRPAQGGLQHRVAGGVAHQQVGQPGRVPVRRAAGAVALGRKPRAPQVLHGGQRAGVQDADAHAVPSFSASLANCSAVMAVKRMRSPAAYRGGRSGSNSSSGVRPISCQPPGDATG